MSELRRYWVRTSGMLAGELFNETTIVLRSKVASEQVVLASDALRLESELARLKAENERLRTTVCPQCGTGNADAHAEFVRITSELAALRARVMALESWLGHYWCHEPRCQHKTTILNGRIVDEIPCDCGLRALLAGDGEEEA